MRPDRLLETWKRWTRGGAVASTRNRARARLARVCVEVAVRAYRSQTRGGLRAPGEAVFTVHFGGNRYQTRRVAHAVFVNFFQPGSDELCGTPSSARVLREHPELRELLAEREFKEGVKSDIRELLAQKGLSVAMFVESPAYPQALGAVIRDTRVANGQPSWAGSPSSSRLARA